MSSGKVRREVAAQDPFEGEDDERVVTRDALTRDARALEVRRRRLDRPQRPVRPRRIECRAVRLREPPRRGTEGRVWVAAVVATATRLAALALGAFGAFASVLGEEGR